MWLTKGLTEFVKQVIKEHCFGEYIFNNSKTKKPYFELKTNGQTPASMLALGVIVSGY
jgi:hypothetical protein